MLPPVPVERFGDPVPKRGGGDKAQFVAQPRRIAHPAGPQFPIFGSSKCWAARSDVKRLLSQARGPEK